MPIVIPKNLPAYEVLANENIFVMPKVRAMKQDIRPIEIAIVNLMPTKIETEIQLMRLLGNSSLQINVTLVKTKSYEAKHTSQEHMAEFYKTFDEIKERSFDGMIVTGAPVETLDFEEVAYWDELCRIMDYAEKKVTSTIFICWGAQASLYYHYGIQKRPLDKKLFGIYKTKATVSCEPLLKGMDDTMYIPMSRHTAINEEELFANKNLKVLAYSDNGGGTAIIKSVDNRKFFLTGHSEYDRDTLKHEYIRDKGKGLDIKQPENYFIDGDIDRIDMKWLSTANLLYYNWLNYYVYQVTPYELK